ncbi:hypothetical protein BGZ74_004092 [Mortierella antarctica]|nr:hypothetical protein BGZ74_004092 [Mortierella antarctica]
MSSTLKRAASTSQSLDCYQPGKFASPPSMRHHRRSVDRIWPPALEVRLARLSMDDDLRRSSLIEAKSGEDGSNDFSPPANYIIPLPPPLLHRGGRYGSLPRHSSVSNDSNSNSNSTTGDSYGDSDDDGRIRRISIWSEHHRGQQSQILELMKRHRHSYGCIHSLHTSSGRSSASPPSVAPSLYSLTPQSFYPPKTMPEQLHPLDQTLTNDHSSTYTHHQHRQHPPQRAQIHVEYLHVRKSDRRSSSNTEHNESAFTSLPMAIAANSLPNNKSPYSCLSSPPSPSSSRRSPLSPSGHDHQPNHLSGTSSPAPSDSEATKDIDSPPSVILHGFLSELSNGHQLYRDPYDSDEECCMLGQSPRSDYASTLDFYMTSSADRSRHQADNPVFFQGFPMMNMAKCD